MVTTGDCTERSDIELVALSRTDPEWFYCLAKRYEPRLFRYIRGISGFSPDEIADVLQDVLINTYAHLNAFDERFTFSSWIYRIAHNQTVSALRKRAVRPIVFFDGEDMDRFADEVSIEKEADATIDREMIDRTLAQLDEKYREVLVLRFLEEMEYAEIADILHKPVSTVGNLIARGRTIFRRIYEQSIQSHHGA